MGLRGIGFMESGANANTTVVNRSCPHFALRGLARRTRVATFHDKWDFPFHFRSLKACKNFEAPEAPLV